MDDLQRRRFFHKNFERVDTRHAYQFVTSNRGVWTYFPTIGQTAGKNMFFLLNFMIEHSLSTTRQGKETSKKDVGQAHWHSNQYIADDIGIERRAVITAFDALESAGIILRKKEGQVRHFAFSARAIRAMKVFSSLQAAREDEDCKVPFSLLLCKYSGLPDWCDGRFWLVGRSLLTSVTVAFDKCDGRTAPYIEEKREENTEIKTPGPSEEAGQAGLPGGELSVSLEELKGAMLGLYGPMTKPDLVTPIIREMVRRSSKEKVLSVIERQRVRQSGLYRWGVKEKDIWLERLQWKPGERQIEEPAPQVWTEQDEAGYRDNLAQTETIPF